MTCRLVVVTRALVLLAMFTGCGTAFVAPLPDARTWVGPLVKLPTGGQFRTVIYYGPWPCSSQLMTCCQRKCSGSGHTLQGCMWLADVKMDFQGTVMQAGSRFGMTHCCSNYGTLSAGANDVSRSRWNNIREEFRTQWGERFGSWPTDANGEPVPGHHIRDLKHGGNPTDWDNIIPFPRDIHETLLGLYNQCYANSPPWTSVGVDHPYGE